MKLKNAWDRSRAGTWGARRWFLAGAAGIAVSAWLASPVRAQGDQYEGVAPGSENKNPLPPVTDEAPKLLWTGFQAAGGGAKVFLQTTGEVPYEMEEAGKKISVVLRNCKIHLENNTRNLDTRFFDTPVAGVKARQRKADVEVTITLKKTGKPAATTQEGPEGTRFVVLEFAAAKASEAAPASTR